MPDLSWCDEAHAGPSPCAESWRLSLSRPINTGSRICFGLLSKTCKTQFFFACGTIRGWSKFLIIQPPLVENIFRICRYTISLLGVPLNFFRKSEKGSPGCLGNYFLSLLGWWDLRILWYVLNNKSWSWKILLVRPLLNRLGDGQWHVRSPVCSFR